MWEGGGEELIVRPVGWDSDREGAAAAGTTKERETETDKERRQGMTFHKGTEAQKGK